MQRQTLGALVACFPVYGRAVLLPEAQRFWEALSVEVRVNFSTCLLALTLLRVRIDIPCSRQRD